MTDSVSFSSFELTIDSALPETTYLKSAFEPAKMSMMHEDHRHQIVREVMEGRFYWLYSNFGKAMPHRDILIDIPSGAELPNLRTTQQVEPNEQLFAIYDDESKILYISNLKKKGFIKEFFGQFTNKEVIIKNIYKNINEFLDIIKSLEAIKFTGSRDFFNREGDLFTNLRNIFGYGEPEEFSIEAKYRTPIEDRLKREILRLAGFQNSGDIKTMVCIGKDERGFDTIFNTNNFIQKINIPLQKDDQFLFPPEEVMAQAIKKLKEIFNV